MSNETMQQHMEKDYTRNHHIFCKQVRATIKEIDKHELQMKNTMEQSIDSAKSNYKFKARVNTALVIIGIVLIANPIVFFWLKSIDMLPHIAGSNELTYFNYFLGGSGIISLVTTFFTNPQRKMTVALGDLVQLHLICNMYMLQFHAIVGKLKQRMEEMEKVSDDEYTSESIDLEQINKNTYDLTLKAVQLVENYLEKGYCIQQGRDLDI
jgi:hypothetical protein